MQSPLNFVYGWPGIISIFFQHPPFRHSASRSVSKGTTYHNHNEPACSSRSTEQSRMLFFSFNLPTRQSWRHLAWISPSAARWSRLRWGKDGGRETEERRQRSGRPKTEERRMLALVQVQLDEQVAWEIRSYLTRPGVLGLYPHLRVKNSTPRTMASRHTAPS